MDAPDPAYLKTVEAHFSALRGKGYFLSGRDIGQVLAWQAEGVPLRIVLNALDEAARRRGVGPAHDRRPLTLSSMGRHVREAAARYAERHVGVDATAPAPAVDRFARLRAALEAAAGDEVVREVLVDARARLDGLEGAGVDAWTAAAEVDGRVADALLARLDEVTRSQLLRDAEEAVDARASEASRAEKRAFEIGLALRRRFAVPELMGVLLDGA